MNINKESKGCASLELPWASIQLPFKSYKQAFRTKRNLDIIFKNFSEAWFCVSFIKVLLLIDSPKFSFNLFSALWPHTTLESGQEKLLRCQPVGMESFSFIPTASGDVSLMRVIDL